MDDTTSRINFLNAVHTSNGIATDMVKQITDALADEEGDCLLVSVEVLETIKMIIETQVDVISQTAEMLIKFEENFDALVAKYARRES